MGKASPFKRLWDLILLDKREIYTIYFYAILSGLVQLSVPIGIQSIVGFVLGASMVTSIYVLIVLVVLGVFIVGVMQINQMKIIEKIQQKIFTRNAFEFAETIPRFNLIKNDSYYLPEQANRFFDTLNVQKGLSKLLLDVPTATIQIMFGMILLALYHPAFIVFGVLLIVILWLILKLTGKNGIATSLQESTYKYAVVAWLEEMARAIKSFKFSQGTHINLTKTDNNVAGYLTARTDHFKVLLVQYKTLVAFKVAITTAMLTIGAYLLLNQQLNIGEFIAAEIVIITVISAVEKLIHRLDSVYDVVTGLEKMAKVTESPLEEDGTMSFNQIDKGIDIKMIDFSFSYPNGKKIFNNSTISIPSNSLVALNSFDGSGKSSLLKILSTSITEFNGSLLYNDIPIGNYKLENLRDKIGLYTQQEDIFTGTVWENISLGKTKVTADKIIQIAKTLGIENFINTLHHGFETKIDPAGNKLSSTLTKNILLLRALSNNPKLLLLDEPWQGLEDTIKNNLFTYLQNLTNTTVIIASSDETFAHKCNYRLQIKNGNISILINK